jgi:type IX secretion system PorP/SprF family membrane protein
MKKQITIFLFAFFVLGSFMDAYGQQLPFFTQFPSDELFFNPAIAGTKRTYDVRINFRDQWVGFPDAPITEGVSLNYRLPSGNMGVGGYIYQDVTGPTQRNDYTLCYAYKIKFPDLVLSFGLAGSIVDYFVDGSKVSAHQAYDPALDLSLNSHAWAPEASAGLFLYNDRFSLGLSSDNLLSMKENLYKTYKPDTAKLGIVELEPHFYGYLSYNFSGNPDFVWQSTLFAALASGTPVYLAYSLRVHVKDKFYIGASYRMGDALALDLGLTIKNNFEVCYSYDLVTSALSHYTSGSQEITLIFSAESLKGGGNKKGSNNDGFMKKKYGYMF